jgi:Phage anti-repressor protein
MDFNIELAKSLIDSAEEFPVDLEQAWVWLGYTRKDSALDTLKSYFEDGVDFSASNRKSPMGGRPSHSYRLTLNCFKELGMLAKTSQGKQIRKYFLECEKIAKAKSERPSIGAYIERIKSIYENSNNVPKGYWTVLSEASGLLLWVETVLKLPVDKFDLMDGSIGIHWANYRADKPWGRDRKQYDYHFPDGRSVKAWSYHNSEMIEFRTWLEDQYKFKLMPPYLLRKYGAMVQVRESELRSLVA